MKKLYEKSPLTLTIILIVVYVVGLSLMQRVSAMIGVRFLAEAVFNAILSAVIIVFVIKNKLTKHFGLCRPGVSAVRMLLYVPLLIIGAVPFFFGMGTEFTVTEIAIRTAMMIGVGFLEEIIFRGFLFREIEKDSLKQAVIITSLTFGIGHVVNLFNGYDITASIIQITGAIALGFMLVFIFVRTGSLIPCIIFHAFNNSISAVSDSHFLVDAVGSQTTASIITASIQIAAAVAYTLYIVKFVHRAGANTAADTDKG